MKRFWHWMRISAAAMAVICVCGLVAVWLLPGSVWAVILPPSLLAQPVPGPTTSSHAVALRPTSVPVTPTPTVTATDVGSPFQSPVDAPTTWTSSRVAEGMPPLGTPSPTATATLPAQPTVTAGIAEIPPATEAPAAPGNAEATPTATETLLPAEAPPATETLPVTETPTVTEVPAVVDTPLPTETPWPTETPLAETPTDPSTPTETPAPTETPLPTATETAVPEPTATQALGTVRYVCGYERCRDSDEYGELIFETGIEVWASSDPDDDRILYTVSHHHEVRVISEQRLWEGPGGLWFELEGGGWMSDFWLTLELCTPENLPQESFSDCMMGEY